MARSPLEYYLDSNLEKRCPVNESGEAILDWGITTQGAKKEKTLYVKNITADRLAIRQPYTHDEDVRIIDYPTVLMGHGADKVTFTYQPHPERIDPLKAGWGFEDVVIG